MHPQRRHRQSLTSTRKNSIFPRFVWRILQISFVVGIFVWIGAAVHFLAKDEEHKNNSSSLRRDAARRHHDDTKTDTPPLPSGQYHLQQHIIVALDLDLDPQRTITIRITLLKDKCPKAYEFITWIIENQQTECRPCTVYRGEPVPSYWGSKDYPDRWDNGGRWGPPYALVQGGFVNSQIKHVEREMHRPQVKRGMVAWAGPQGVHFFIALAEHPEWGHEHTVWGHVFEEDMHLLDALVKDRPLKVLEHNIPVVTNFFDPMPFRIYEYD